MNILYSGGFGGLKALEEFYWQSDIYSPQFRHLQINEN